MKKIFLLVVFLLPLVLWSQNQIPVAVNDTTETLSQVAVSLNVLLNDYDADGDDIRIRNLYSSRHGDNWYEDSIVSYISENYVGMDSMRYKIREVSGPGVSEAAYIFVNVLENPDVPLAVNDTFTVKRLEPTVLDILINDSDPNGDEFHLDDVDWYSTYLSIQYYGDSVIATTKYATPGETSFEYYNIEANTPELYLSNIADVHLFIEENPDIPVAVRDTFQVTGGITEILDVLANDIDPLGDTVEIHDHSLPSHGSLSLENNQFHYTATTSYTGEDSFRYGFRYQNKPWLHTLEVWVKIAVLYNPDRPDGVPDYGSGMAFTEIPIEVLSNDMAINSDSIEILDVKTSNTGYSVSFSSDTVVYIPSLISVGVDTAFYRIRKVNDPDYYSEWIPIIVSVSQNPDWPICTPDSAATIGGIPTIISILENDIIADTIEIEWILPIGSKKGKAFMEGDSLIYIPYMNASGQDSIFYMLYNIQYEPFLIGGSSVKIEITSNRSYDSIYINNINAGINSNNLLFHRYKDLPEPLWGDFDEPHFEVPKGSGTHSIFHNTIWIGGLDNQGKLHIAARRYYGQDFQRGPISDNYDSAFLVDWQRTWKIRKDQINTHISDWWKDNYDMPEAILNWPGNGDPAYGMPPEMAPYFDRNDDGYYNPDFGDYPLIRGDECIFYIVNDDRQHTETKGDSLQVEIHCMAYAYDAPEDSILNNTIFIHYDLINRSENTYYDTYFGVFTDFALGYEWDDYVGCHVMGNSFYAYNYEYDGSINNPGPGEYGDKPPAQSTTFLAGPFIDSDNEDNPSSGCGYNINGVNFDNGIIDDERHGMSYFIFFGGAGVMEDPQIDIEYYQYLQAHWRDNTPLHFGGNGHYYWSPGPECRYMWPGDSDPYNWGTECVLPNDGYNQDGRWWTEEEINGYPGDRRGMGSSGPFTFYPGDVQEVDLAYMFANSYHSADSSKNLLSKRLLELRQRVLDGEIVIPNDELDINEPSLNQVSFDLYPNPAGNLIYINTDIEFNKADYRIINAMGTVVKTGQLANEISISGLKPGFYIMNIITESGITSNKFIKY